MKETCLDKTKPIAKNLMALAKEIRGCFSFLATSSLSSELSQTEHRVVGYICHHPGCISTDLVEEFNCVRSTVSQMVNSVAKKGYIELKTSKEDKRKVLLFPTDLALKQEEEAKRLFDRFDKLVENGIDEGEKEAFLSVCAKIEENIMKEVKEK